ncbi:MAG: hypothetical protein IJF33_00635 [Clostridia bacterium]|nr:hypothetical protein [Clostridia bacterium]
MKIWKEKTWQHEATGTDENAMLFGVNIFGYSWVPTGETAIIKNRSATIYSVRIDDTECFFAALEVSHGVWDFYLFKY